MRSMGPFVGPSSSESPASFFAQQIVFERVSLGDESPLGALTESGAT